MKILVASDIHGSAFYMEKLLDRINEENPERILLLGDILYHGPRNALPGEYDPKKVISMLNPLKDRIMCVRGNCDTEVDQMVLDFPILADYIMINVENRLIYATHGHIYNAKNMLPCAKGSILLHGHTHVPKCEVYEDFIYMNPGSVSIPKEDSAHSYMIIDGKNVVWRNVCDGNETGMEYTLN